MVHILEQTLHILINQQDRKETGLASTVLIAEDSTLSFRSLP
jgi:hypothetical protein